MPFAREINRLFIGAMMMFIIVVAAAAYWAVFGSETILTRPDNPRLVEAVGRIQRGGIYDTNEQLLAETPLDVQESTGALIRRYSEPSTYSALGYYSLRYGEGGIESAYNSLLNGSARVEAVSERIADTLLHRPQIGGDIQVTLDLGVQSELYQAMEGLVGAAVMIDVPSGAVVALISLPDYDPNTLDTNWDELTSDPGNPFFNRALIGAYQPGGALQSALMSAALLTQQSLDEPIDDATLPVTINGLTLTCALPLPPMSLSLRDAFAFACPRPFETLSNSLGDSTVYAAIETLQLDRTPALLEIFRTAPLQGITVTPAPSFSADRDLSSEGLGQGSITVSPLMMAMVASAIVNDGNAPQPYLLQAQRIRGTEAWESLTAVRPSIPMLTANTARQLQDLMRNAVANGAAQNAGRPAIDIGGHASLAYSGENALSWFIGFATLGGSDAVAIAVVIEGTADPGLAADIGGGALFAAQHSRAG